MTEPAIREVRPEDAPALTALWAQTFGDSEALIRCFFRLLPGMGGGVTAEADGRSVGMAFLIDDLQLVRPDGSEARCGYLYAVAVDPAFRGRGLGAALSRAAFALGRKRGAEILCTEPADAGLFGWYEKALGVSCSLRRRCERIPAAAGAPVRHEAEHYREKREALLAGLPHLRPGFTALNFAWHLCAANGGGLYAVGDGIAAAYAEGGRAVIRELLAPAGADRRALAASLSAHLQTGEALLYTADPAGEPYLSAAPGSLPADTVWGLSFD